VRTALVFANDHEVVSDPILRTDFDACVTLYQDYIKQTSKTRTAANTVNMSEIKTGKRKFDKIEDRYYTKEDKSGSTRWFIAFIPT
jgi:hypothetical protein